MIRNNCRTGVKMYLKNLTDLFFFQIRELLDAEKQQLDMLPFFRNSVNNAELKVLISGHIEETKEQIKRLEYIGKKVRTAGLSEHQCIGMKGLSRELHSFLKIHSESHVKDVGIISLLQRIEQYEIACYVSLVQFGQLLDKEQTVYILKETVDEELGAYAMFNDIGIYNINKKAVNPVLT